MPSKSAPQARLMAACSHGATYDKCPPAKVAREFNQADKGTGIMAKGYSGKVESFAEGGPVLGRTREFLKEPDRFRTSGAKGQFQPKPEPTEDVYPKSGKGAPGKDKSLPAVKPRK